MTRMRKGLGFSHRLVSGVALLVLTVASLGLPCFAAGRVAAARPMAMDGAAPSMPCEAQDTTDRAMLCAAPGSNAPLSVAVEELPSSDGLAALSALAPIDGLPRPSTARLVARTHSPPGTDRPAFLLHSTFLI